MIFRYIKEKWVNYRYRFVPWLIVNLKERKVRKVEIGQNDKVISDDDVLKNLKDFFAILEETNVQQVDHTNIDVYRNNLQKMKFHFGFKTERRQSLLPNGGLGVFLTHGRIKPGVVVSMYPGTIYKPYEPILLQSIGNPFIFRCIDGVLIDGNDKNLSKFMFRSCCQRDRLGPYLTSDMSWITEFPVNPLAIGQYINNQSTDHPANVAYQEYDIPIDFPFHLRQFIPNVFYCSANEEDHLRQTRVVVLVSLRHIEEGEELFSSYFTVVH